MDGFLFVAVSFGVESPYRVAWYFCGTFILRIKPQKLNPQSKSTTRYSSSVVERTLNIGCVPLGWSENDHLDLSVSKEPKNPFPEWIYRFLWYTVSVILFRIIPKERPHKLSSKKRSLIPARIFSKWAWQAVWWQLSICHWGSKMQGETIALSLFALKNAHGICDPQFLSKCSFVQRFRAKERLLTV